jgi:hypothetical protein
MLFFPSHKKYQKLTSRIPFFIVASLSLTHNTDSLLIMVSCLNPYSYAATQLRKERPATMGIQSQRRDGAVKKCKKRATKAKHKLRNYAIDAGGVFNPIENCMVCKAKHLNVRGIKTKIPRRAHHKACGRNLKTRGASVFVNKRREAASRAAIANTTVKKLFFQVMTLVGPSASITVITVSTAMSIADPTSLRHELDEQMKALESEADGNYYWLDQKKYPDAIGFMVDYICSLFEHRKPTSTTATSQTAHKQEANEKYRAFFPPGSLSFTFGMECNVNEPPSPHYHALEGQSILQVDWKLAFPGVNLLCFNCKHFRNATQHLIHDRTNFSKRKNCFLSGHIWVYLHGV